MKCYELKKCPFKDTDSEGTMCPPYELGIGCWEYNWVEFYKEMPDCKAKEEWREIMLEKCPQCKVYEIHKKEVDEFLDGLREV